MELSADKLMVCLHSLYRQMERGISIFCEIVDYNFLANGIVLSNVALSLRLCFTWVEAHGQ